MAETRERRNGWSRPVLLLIAAFAATLVAVLLVPRGWQVSSWWPATGFSVALLALSPRGLRLALALAVVVAVTAANLAGGNPLDVSVEFGLASGAEALAACYVLCAGREGPVRLRTQDDYRRLVLAAVVGGLVFAALGSVTVAYLDGGSLLGSGWSLLAAHTAAVLVLFPVLLVPVVPIREVANAEFVVQNLVSAAVNIAVFAPGQNLPLTFAPLPVIIWAALRFPLFTVTCQLAGAGVLATVMTELGYGPFAAAVNRGDLTPVVAAALCQGYLICAALLSLPLSIAVHERRTLVGRIEADGLLFRRNFADSIAGMMILRGDTELAISDLNAAAVTILGNDERALLGRRLEELIDHPDLATVMAEVADGTRTRWNAVCGLQSAAGRPDGRVNVALARLSEIDRDPDARAESFVSVQLVDLTSEYDSWRRREAAEKLTSATLDTADCIIVVTDLDGLIVRVNDATERITGYPAADLLHRPLWATPVAPYDQADVQALLVWPNRSGEPVVREGTAHTRDGRRLRIVWSSNVVRDEQGTPTNTVVTGIDITGERAAAGLVTHLMSATVSTVLVGIDPEGLVTIVNAGGERLLGYAAAELVGVPFHELFERRLLLDRTGATTPEEAQRRLLSRAGEESDPSDWTWLSKDGSQQVVSMSLSAVLDSPETGVGYLCVARDVTEQRAGQRMVVAALERERTAAERLRALDQAKNDFVSTASHELRTPVTNILGYAEMLADGSVVEAAPEQVPMLATITRNAERLLAMCNDLLQLGSLENGGIRWAPVELDLRGVLPGVVDAIQPLLQGRDLSVTVEGPAEPLVVLGDQSQVERLLINLLSNAVKFTEDGGAVECDVLRQEGQAVIVVSDSGIGIPESEQSELFDRFFRASTAEKRAIQGTGLGLSIVSSIVAAHEGHIEVHSEEGVGTTFTVRLPLLVDAHVRPPVGDESLRSG